DSGQEGADQKSRAAAPVPLRRQTRHPEMPTRSRSASAAAGSAWPLLLLALQRLSALSDAGRLPVRRPRQQGRSGERRSPRAAARPSAQGALVERGRPSLPAPSLALGRLSRRGEELARAGQSRPTG